ncbi:hypothetical protein TKK_0010662 [Trichogramma kaykai]
MQSSDSFNCAIKVKEEPSHDALIENNSQMIYEKPDLKNLQLLSWQQVDSTDTPRTCEQKHENLSPRFK